MQFPIAEFSLIEGEKTCKWLESEARQICTRNKMYVLQPGELGARTVYLSSG